MPESWNGPTAKWSQANLDALLKPVERWADKHGVPPSRIVAAEFGCGRQALGAREYLSDLIALLNAKGYHWAFYSYREDTWDSMDYELGAELGDPGGRDLLEQGKYRVKPWKDNPLFDVLKKEFQRRPGADPRSPVLRLGRGPRQMAGVATWGSPQGLGWKDSCESMRSALETFAAMHYRAT